MLQATNRLAEAEPLYRRALEIVKQTFGPDHPDVGTCLNNLAALLLDTNRLAEAEPLMRRALAIDEASFGPDHPNVSTCLNNLAQLLQDTHRLAEAEPLMRRALAIAIASLGGSHPVTLRALRNYRIMLGPPLLYSTILLAAILPKIVRNLEMLSHVDRLLMFLSTIAFGLGVGHLLRHRSMFVLWSYPIESLIAFICLMVANLIAPRFSALPANVLPLVTWACLGLSLGLITHFLIKVRIFGILSKALQLFKTFRLFRRSG